MRQFTQMFKCSIFKFICLSGGFCKRRLNILFYICESFFCISLRRLDVFWDFFCIIFVLRKKRSSNGFELLCILFRKVFCHFRNTLVYLLNFCKLFVQFWIQIIDYSAFLVDSGEIFLNWLCHLVQIFEDFCVFIYLILNIVDSCYALSKRIQLCWKLFVLLLHHFHSRICLSLLRIEISDYDVELCVNLFVNI